MAAASLIEADQRSRATAMEEALRAGGSPAVLGEAAPADEGAVASAACVQRKSFRTMVVHKRNDKEKAAKEALEKAISILAAAAPPAAAAASLTAATIASRKVQRRRQPERI